MQAVRPAQVHNLEGVEINVDEWDPDSDWSLSDWTMYGHLSDDNVQWIGVSRVDGNGMRRLRTFLDEDFDSDWGPPTPRRLEDRGRFAKQPDGSFKQQLQSIDAPGAGLCKVQVGNRGFTCLRVYDIKSEPTDQGTLMEAYLTQEGRTVLCRRYNGTRWQRAGDSSVLPWDEELPDADQLTVDGVTFVHWYDCLTGLALGYDAGQN